MKGGWPVHPKFFPDFHSFHQQPSVLRGEGGTAEEREGRCLCFLLSVQGKAAPCFARFQSADWAAARQGDVVPWGRGFGSGAGRFRVMDPRRGWDPAGGEGGEAQPPARGWLPKEASLTRQLQSWGDFSSTKVTLWSRSSSALGLLLPGAAGNRCLAAAQAGSGAPHWSWSWRRW